MYTVFKFVATMAKEETPGSTGSCEFSIQIWVPVSCREVQAELVASEPLLVLSSSEPGERKTGEGLEASLSGHWGHDLHWRHLVLSRTNCGYQIAITFIF
jgi:hypothetical protein